MERSQEMEAFLADPSGCAAFNEQVARISRTDLRETDSFSDFIVNMALENGNRIRINGMLDIPANCSWLDIEVGDKISFSFSDMVPDSYTPEETASGAEPKTQYYKNYENPVLLDKAEGAARNLHSQCQEPESGWVSKLKQPRSKQASNTGGQSQSLRGRAQAEAGSAAGSDAPPPEED